MIVVPIGYRCECDEKRVRLHLKMQCNRLSNLRKRCKFIYWGESVKNYRLKIVTNKMWDMKERFSINILLQSSFLCVILLIFSEIKNSSSMV